MARRKGVALGSVVHWLLRRGALYVLLAVAVAVGPLVWHAIGSGGLGDELMSPGEVSRQSQRLRTDALADFELRRKAVDGRAAASLDARRIEARRELATVSEQLAARTGWLASIRPRMILERKQLELRQAALNGEIRLLETALERDRLRADLRSVMAPTPAAIAAARAGCDRANQDARAFNTRHALDRSMRNVLTDQAARLTAAAKAACAEYDRRSAARTQALARAGALQARLAGAEGAYVRAGADSRDVIARIRIDLSGTLQSILIKAGVLLAAIIATPYLIRLVFFFILAPLAERRPQVRLPWPGGSRPTPPELPQVSTTSAAIRLGAGEELLVRQGFLQSTSSAGAKTTRALLDWRRPFVSLASGLAFLTRIEGAGETTTVSAVNDPFAEVAVLNLPPGGACVLHARALVAVATPTGHPLRITSHWRLGSLHAWLTFQLRYLMFHGPARLVIKGGRGVRVEPAERGRVFGQDQLVGFSADLAYAVTRTETFWPYFLGLEPLLKDKVEAGEGVLIVEEAPMAGGRAGPRRGLEGAADALLKAVGG